MSTAHLSAIQTIIGRLRAGAHVDIDTVLFGDGLSLDSLETAELSASLEDQFGKDPFSEGQMPNTVKDVLAFYEA